jgi:hypothetical protein
MIGTKIKHKFAKAVVRAPSMAHGFVAGFLLLRITLKADRGSGVQKASHNTRYTLRPQ